MKVLLLSPLPPPVGGIASWSVNILAYYQQHDTEIDLLHFNTALKSRGITQINLSTRLRTGVKDNFQLIPSFIGFIHKKKPDVIHITSSGSLGLIRDLLILNIAKLKKIPTVVHFRFGRIPELQHLDNWEWKLLNIIINLSSSVIVLDNKSQKLLTKIGFNHVHCIPNPISERVEHIMPSDSQINRLRRKNFSQVLFVGHVTKNKGIFELIAACISLKDIIDEVVLVGPYEEDIISEVFNKNIDDKLKIKFTGALEKEVVLDYMAQASLLVLPSYSEGFPNVIIEAMAMGCPVIATNVGAVPDMLDIDSEYPCGVAIEPRNTTILAESICTMISDETKATEYSKNALKKVKNSYTLAKIITSYEKVWKSLTSN